MARAVVLTMALMLCLMLGSSSAANTTNACMQACVILTVRDVQECSLVCKKEIDQTHVSGSMKPEPNPYLVNDSSNCPNGYTPTPAISKSETPASRPNIVLILLDDQDELVTPYLEAMPFVKELLFDKGTHFTQAFSASSICCAARCQILTGLYGHNVGVLTNAGPYGGFQAFSTPLTQKGDRMKAEDGTCINNEDRTVPLFLKQSAGYRTGIFGKYINGLEGNGLSGHATHVSPGWSQFSIGADHFLYAGYNYDLLEWTEGDENLTYTHYGDSESDYSTDVLGRKAVEFIKNSRTDGKTDPLFMYVSSTAPHFPIMAAKRHANYTLMWEERFNEIVASRKSYFEDDISDKASWLRLSGHARSRVQKWKWPQIDFQKRMGSLYAVDEMVKSIAQQLDLIGELDNTVFVLTSDNGYNHGSHRLIHKMAPYEESIRVPFAMSGPGISKGVKIDEPVILTDLAPTFLELAGLKVPEYMDGHSLLPLVSPSSSPAPSFKHRTEVLLQYAAYGGGELIPSQLQGIYEEVPPIALAVMPVGFMADLPPYKGLRNLTHVFIEWQITRHLTEYELYDLRDDPYQMDNLWHTLPNKIKYKTLVHEMKARMDELMQCSGANCV